MHRKIVVVLLSIIIITLSLGIALNTQREYMTTGPDSTKKEKTKYDSNNYDVKYHPDAKEMDKQGSFYDVKMKSIKVKDPNGKSVSVPYNVVQGNVTYYQPGTYKYGPTSYVPYYEDSVLLSRKNNSITKTPTYLSSVAKGGFCEFNKSNPEKIESACNAISNKTCAATTCCVLLGGQKCVSGNERGPTKQSNYSDVYVLNKDLYYHQGKCYGNCTKNPAIYRSLPKMKKKV